MLMTLQDQKVGVRIVDVVSCEEDKAIISAEETTQSIIHYLYVSFIQQASTHDKLWKNTANQKQTQCFPSFLNAVELKWVVN